MRWTTASRFTAATFALALTVVGTSAPAQAICGSPRLFNSGYSYVVTPGCEALGCGEENTSITDNFEGRFWALGSGDPALESGRDNGSFPALGGWMYIYPDYPAIFNSTWAASAGIDGCIDSAPDPRRCMVVLLMDESPNDAPFANAGGFFALLTKAPDPLSNYDFGQDGNIILAPVPRPLYTSLSQVSVCENTLDICTSDADCPDGTPCDWEAAVHALIALPYSTAIESLYLDPECGGPEEIILGYQIYTQTVLSGTAPPGPGVESWDAAGPIAPLGGTVSTVLKCGRLDSQRDLYIAAALVVDSGYETVYLSSTLTRVECGPNLADPEPLSPRKPRSRKLPRRGRTQR